MPDIIDICPVSELPPGSKKIIEHQDLEIGVFHCAGDFYAIEDRCSHDDGPLAEGPFNANPGALERPRPGSFCDLKPGRPKPLPAYEPVDTFPVIIAGD